MTFSSKNKTAITILCLTFSVVIYLFYESNEGQIDADVVEIVSEKEIKNDIVFNLPNTTSNQIIESPFYTFSYNEEAEQPDWIAYTLYPLADSLRVKRKDNFRADPRVVSGSASLKDYKSSGYDRGHLAPSKALSYSKEAMNASFYMSNMSPQLPSFNRGIWKKIEAKVLDWSKQSDSLYVVTGPVLDNPLDTIGGNKVIVPRAYYKTIIRFYKKSLTGIAFLINNEKSSKKVIDFTTSIDSVERITNLNFYYQLDSLRQHKVESNNILENFLATH